MDATPSVAAEQAALWNGSAGQAWVDTQDVLDQMFQPFETLLAEAVTTARAACVLDIGCGTGTTTLAAARQLGASGRCTGIDISEPMIRVARRRAAQDQIAANFIAADAQFHALEPGSVDMFISRFGVMFFEDPAKAFANLHRAAKAGAKCQFIVWRSAEENPFMTTAERAAAPLLPSLPPRRPNMPGQFAFADRDRIQGIMEEAGWVDVDIRPLDVECTFLEKDLVRYLTRLGPVGRILGEVGDEVRRQVITTARTAFDRYVKGSEVRFNAACWLMSARAFPSSAR
ncbi:class I SAM-dependent methyltransferase [Eleftheria terrae]|uniref:class I SAM-dependent methyltransferase n=1 Tax=Eleftheria terrae TaxID=1597781 RepID=UPI00263AEDB6|nr:class I SAM-dependent methyltransferase [Eleftheria terrae]WKB53195.1 class I SAM-dependent methyltransferase [Eleftheria terrae]